MGTVEELAVDILRACQQSDNVELKILLHQVCNVKVSTLYTVIFVERCRMFFLPEQYLHGFRLSTAVDNSTT